MKKQLLTIAVAALAMCASAEDLLCLRGEGINGKAGRFKVTDISWPTTTEAAEICLWKDDKVAACSITIDDNCLMDVRWWTNMCAKYNLVVTHFLVTGGIKTPGTKKTHPMNGTWADWQVLHDSGYSSLQSHTISHFPNAKEKTEEKMISEYKDSRDAINANVKGANCLAVAAPYGVAIPDLLTQYYIANRGTSGTPNPPNKINYANVCKGNLKEAFLEVITTGKTDKPPKWANNKSYYRGWIAPLFHYVKGNRQFENNPNEALLATVAKYSDKLWIAFFVDVAKYGQERDSAKLTTTVDANAVRISITDRMRNDIFDYPLTVKVRLPDTWTGDVAATQAGKAAAVRVVEHEGARFALVDCIPDKGETLPSRK